MGALAGDGHLTDSHYTYRVEFTVNEREERHYARFLAELSRRLFHTDLKIKSRGDGALRVMLHSKKIHSFLSQYFPKGRKNSLKIPDWIDTEQKAAAYLRGLMDTDGSLFFAKRGTYEKNSYPVMEMKLHDKDYLDEIGTLLNLLDLNYYRSSEIKVQMNGKDKLRNWMDKVGFSNPSKFSRYVLWRIQNCCPPDTTLDQRLTMIREHSAGMAE